MQMMILIKLAFSDISEIVYVLPSTAHLAGPHIIEKMLKGCLIVLRFNVKK